MLSANSEFLLFSTMNGDTELSFTMNQQSSKVCFYFCFMSNSELFWKSCFQGTLKFKIQQVFSFFIIFLLFLILTKCLVLSCCLCEQPG